MGPERVSFVLGKFPDGRAVPDGWKPLMRKLASGDVGVRKWRRDLVVVVRRHAEVIDGS